MDSKVAKLRANFIGRRSWALCVWVTDTDVMIFASVVLGGLKSPSVGKDINVVNEFPIRVTWVGE